MCQQESFEENKLLVEKLSFVLFADSDWKPFALPAEKLSPSLSKLLLCVQKNLGVELFSERFKNILTTLLANNLFYPFFVSPLQQKKFLEEFFLCSVLKSAPYVFKKSSVKNLFLKIFCVFFKSFSHIERKFSGLSPKKLSSNCRNNLQDFRRSLWRKKVWFFQISFPNWAKRFPTSEWNLTQCYCNVILPVQRTISVKTFFLKKVVFLPCLILRDSFFWRWQKKVRSGVRTAFFVSRLKFSWIFFARSKLSFLFWDCEP